MDRRTVVLGAAALPVAAIDNSANPAVGDRYVKLPTGQEFNLGPPVKAGKYDQLDFHEIGYLIKGECQGIIEAMDKHWVVYNNHIEVLVMLLVRRAQLTEENWARSKAEYEASKVRQSLKKEV